MVSYDFLYDKEYFRDQFDKSHFVEKELTYFSYENAYIVPKDTSAEVYINNEACICNAIEGDVSLPRDSISSASFINRTVVCLGAYIPTWGHILTDVISRFWILGNESLTREFDDCCFLLTFANRQGGVFHGTLSNFLK